MSTNSITQGEQVRVLWEPLLARGLRIHFAHRTFQWNNEARGNAAVHCVIIGFSSEPIKSRRLFDYSDVKGEPQEVAAQNINPYLVDAADIMLPTRTVPLCDVPAIAIGNKPIDGGHYLFTATEKDEFLRIEPRAQQWFRRWVGADEFINGWERWCLWLGDCPADELRRMPEVLRRVAAVRDYRLASKSAPTRKLASTPTRFHVENIPTAPYLVIPEVSSERRAFIPIGYLDADTLASNKLRILPRASLAEFGTLTSTMHMAWARYTAGRLKSDFQYSVNIVYNNFPWPDLANDKHRAAIESAAQGVLDTRAQFPDATLADLYDPLTMPPALVKAHQALDRAVDAAYVAAEKAAGRKPPKLGTDAERVAFLFERYQALTSLLPAAKPPRKGRARPAAALPTDNC